MKERLTELAASIDKEEAPVLVPGSGTWELLRMRDLADGQLFRMLKDPFVVYRNEGVPYVREDGVWITNAVEV